MNIEGYHSMMAKAGGVKTPYISPDGGAYWDTGFKGGSGCEYVFDCIWKRWPRNPATTGPRPEYVIMGDIVYTGIIVGTFNYQATGTDTITTQAARTEIRHSLSNDWLDKPSILRVKHRVGDNYLRIGFDGGPESSVYKSSLSDQSNSMYLCGHRLGQYDDGTPGPMPDNTVLIFGVRIYQNGNLVKDLQPAQANGRPCFYEAVSGQNIYSSGETDGKYGLY